MSIAELGLADLVGVVLGFLFTLVVFTYIFGDNPLFRLSIHLFIGVASGYAAMIVIYNVILPHLIVPILGDNRNERLLALVPLLLGLLLFTKLSPRLVRVGNFPMAFLVGVGAAAAIGGSIVGTLFPQTSASINLLDLQAARATGTSPGSHLINGGIILVGTLTTLAYFHFSTRSRPDQTSQRQPWIEWASQVGSYFIAITFGVLFANVYAAALAALVERLSFLVDFIRPFIQ